MIHYSQYLGTAVHAGKEKHFNDLMFCMSRQTLEEIDILAKAGISLSKEQRKDILVNSYRNMGNLVVAYDSEGYMAGYIFTTKADPNLVAGLFVDKKYRRVGVGKHLYRTLGKALNLKLWARVAVQNKAAVKFFEGVGFVPVTMEMRVPD